MHTPTLLLVGVLAVAGAGCMSDVTQHGKTFTYDCSGLGKGWGDCAEKADAQCGAHNYTIVSRNGEAEGKHEGNTEMKRTLVVSCN
jgi:hypothetical protein